MRIIIAILLPFLLCFTIRRPIAGIICAMLQFALIGWLLAALRALDAPSLYRLEARLRDIDPY